MAALGATALAAALVSRLGGLIERYGVTVTLKQADTGTTIASVPAIVQLAAAGDHTPFFTSTLLDTFAKPLFTVLIAGPAPEFGGTAPITTEDFVTMAPPGSISAVDYSVRAISYECLEAGTAVSTRLLVSL